MQKIVLLSALASASAGVGSDWKSWTGGNSVGPKFTVEVNDPSLPNGVGSLNLEGVYQREVVEGVNAGVRYEYNVDRARPSSVFVSVSAHARSDRPPA